MNEIAWQLHERERILRYALIGDIDDATLVATFETIWARHPHARNWDALGDLRRYRGRITWNGVMELSRIRRAALPHDAPIARTTLIADPAWYQGFVKAIDEAFFARRFRVFATEADALAWLREPAVEPAAEAEARGARGPAPLEYGGIL